MERSLERSQSMKAMTSARQTITSQKADLLAKNPVLTMPRDPNTSPQTNRKMSRQISNVSGGSNAPQAQQQQQVASPAQAAFSRQASSVPMSRQMSNAVVTSTVGGAADGSTHLSSHASPTKEQLADDAAADTQLPVDRQASGASDASSQAPMDAQSTTGAALLSVETHDDPHSNQSVPAIKAPGTPDSDVSDRSEHKHTRHARHTRHHARASPGKHDSNDESALFEETGGAGAAGARGNRVSRLQSSANMPQSPNQSQHQGATSPTPPPSTARQSYANRVKQRQSSKNLVQNTGRGEDSTHSQLGTQQHTARDSQVRKRSVIPQDDPEVLKDVSKTATAAEISIRAAILSAIAEPIGLNSTKKVINHSSQIIENVANIITTNERTVWNSLIVHKHCADMMVKLKNVLKSVLGCKSQGIVGAEVTQIISECMPLIGMGGNSFSNEWFPDVLTALIHSHAQAEVSSKNTARSDAYDPHTLHHAITTMLLATSSADANVQAQASQLPTFYKGEINATHYKLVAELHTIVLNMNTHVVQTLTTEVVTLLHDLVVEYGEVKHVAVCMEDSLKKEADRVRMIMAREMELVKKELDKTKAQLSETMLENASLLKNMDDANGFIHELQELPEMISKCKNDITELTLERNELRQHVDKMNIQNAQIIDDMHKMQETLKATQTKLNVRTNNDICLCVKVWVLTYFLL
jgi:hypothetical protein